MLRGWIATIALLSWPLVGLWLYRTRALAQATLWTILGGLLLLPVDAQIKIEGVPQFDKVSIPNLTALACSLMLGRNPLRLGRFGIMHALMLVFILSPFITAELNHDPIVLPNRVVPAETHYDAASAIVAQLMLLIPFLLGRHFLRHTEENLEILRTLVVGGLIYSLPMLFEIRMSPQLHTWIYGYFPHSFAQQVRDGGFRPVVFLGHGLVAAFFIMTTAVAAAALWRTETRVFRFLPAGITTAYLGTLLVLCKTLGALVYGIVLIPLVRWAPPRLQTRIAVIFVVVALGYPLLRIAELVPTDAMVAAAASISADRAGSLRTRFDQEGQLLERASERLLFGWGRFGRNRIFDENSGRDLSRTDGQWIITIGSFGLVGFLAEFGLLALPVFRVASALKFTESKRDAVLLVALTLILAINIFELLPNATLTPWTWLLAGALLGRAESLSSAARGPRSHGDRPLRINGIARVVEAKV
jgi:hypothetical protein